MSFYMQSLYIEVTLAVIPEGIFPSKHTSISALKEAFDILLPFLWPEPLRCCALFLFSWHFTRCAVSKLGPSPQKCPWIHNSKIASGSFTQSPRIQLVLWWAEGDGKGPRQPCNEHSGTKLVPIYPRGANEDKVFSATTCCIRTVFSCSFGLM